MAILASMIPDTTLENLTESEMKALEGRITKVLVQNPDIRNILQEKAGIADFVQRKGG